MTKSLTPEEIDAVLPQTQCGLCGYGGCMPYAEALIFEHAPINLCPPGGIDTLNALGQLLSLDPTPFHAEIASQAKPKVLAVIREAECIGCTKCIQVCPVDAILGSAKLMHTVIAGECTGCELCVPACPVDCIDMSRLENTGSHIAPPSPAYARERYNSRNRRLEVIKNAKMPRVNQASQGKKQDYIQAAIERAKAKKLERRE